MKCAHHHRLQRTHEYGDDDVGLALSMAHGSGASIADSTRDPSKPVWDHGDVRRSQFLTLPRC